MGISYHVTTEQRAWIWRKLHPFVSGRAETVHPLECCPWEVILAIFWWQNLSVGLWYIYNSFSWRKKNNFNLPGWENFTKLNSSKPGNRGECHFARLRRWLSSVNTLMTKNFSRVHSEAVPKLVGHTFIARAYFISIFQGGQWKAVLLGKVGKQILRKGSL